jgi:hypothetical protein
VLGFDPELAFKHQPDLKESLTGKSYVKHYCWTKNIHDKVQYLVRILLPTH